LAVENKEDSVQNDQQLYGEPSRRNGALWYLPCKTVQCRELIYKTTRRNKVQENLALFANNPKRSPLVTFEIKALLLLN